jgi:2,3-bisphosphoglycerate-independent phosphoglycerate mutase
MGNSEIGHTIIGSGKIIYTDLVKISKEAKEDNFINNPAFKELFSHVKKYNSVLHVKGLVSPGGVHSHSEHLFAFLKAAKKAGIEKVAIHAFTDGRDTPPQSADRYLQELEDVIEEVGIGFIATASGRFYAMDRDNNWDRVKKVENAIFEGKGVIKTGTPSKIIKGLHQQAIGDEHFEPMIFLDENGQSYQVQDNDGIFFFNFRKDRTRMLSQRILERKRTQNLCFVTMTEYDKNFDCLIAFPPEEIETTLPNEVSIAGLTQAHIAETEKFAHATYYLNGGKQEPHVGEKQILVESRKDIRTHDEAPEMRAKEIADEAIRYIKKGVNFVFINFANPDMVGHTANPKQLIKAIELLDKELGRVVEESKNNHACVIITADHGNAEVYEDLRSGQKHTAHTENPVPLIIIGEEGKVRNGQLSDIAPTILELFNIVQPKSMTGQSLICRD